MGGTNAVERVLDRILLSTETVIDIGILCWAQYYRTLLTAVLCIVLSQKVISTRSYYLFARKIHHIILSNNITYTLPLPRSNYCMVWGESHIHTLLYRLYPRDTDDETSEQTKQTNKTNKQTNKQTNKHNSYRTKHIHAKGYSND